MPRACRQHQNLEDCFDKLQALVDDAAIVPLVRVQRVGATEEGKVQRVVEKRFRSDVKCSRRGIERD